MKVTTSTPEKEFEPIVLTITIESKEDLIELYARHRITMLQLKGAVEKLGDTTLLSKINNNSSNDTPVFDCLKEEVFKRRLLQ